MKEINELRNAMLENENLNLSWCKPMFSEDGTIILAINDLDIVGAWINGKSINDFSTVTPEMIDKAEIEKGCKYCPCFMECCALDDNP